MSLKTSSGLSSLHAAVSSPVVHGFSTKARKPSKSRALSMDCNKQRSRGSEALKCVLHQSSLCSQCFACRHVFFIRLAASFIFFKNCTTTVVLTYMVQVQVPAQCAVWGRYEFAAAHGSTGGVLLVSRRAPFSWCPCPCPCLCPCLCPWSSSPRWYATAQTEQKTLLSPCTGPSKNIRRTRTNEPRTKFHFIIERIKYKQKLGETEKAFARILSVVKQ